MVDWKRCRHVLRADDGARWNRYGLHPVDFMLDNQFNHYVLQQQIICSQLFLI